MQYSSLPSDLWCWPDFSDLTPEDRYYLLYLYTNPHVPVTGCYALPRRIAAAESGYNEETSDRILARLVEAGGWLEVDPATREVLLLRWPEINPGWFVKNSNTYKGLVKSIVKIKSNRLRAVVQSWLLSDTPSEWLAGGFQAPCNPPASITHHHHTTSPQITSPSPTGHDDGDTTQNQDLTPLLKDISLAEHNKLIPKLYSCLAAGHSVHACQQALDDARHGATPGPPWYGNWYGLAHHKLSELAKATAQTTKTSPQNKKTETEDKPDPTPQGKAFFEFVQNQ